MRIDNFLVTVRLPDGSQRTFRRDGAVPKVEVKDPLAGHKALLADPHRQGHARRDGVPGDV